MSDSLTPAQLKNRLLGAALLVILAVLLIPLILGEPKQSTETAPAPDNGAFQSKIQPLNSELNVRNAQPDSDQNTQTGLVLKTIDTVQSKPVSRAIAPVSEVNVTKAKPTESQVVKKPVKASPKKVVQPKPTKTVKKTPAPAVKSAIEPGWVVQAGVFSKAENANSVAKVLRNNGFTPHSGKTKTSLGQATRVWVGPYASKAEAQKASRKLEKSTGNGGFVKAFPF
ncbi:MAG: SPOR domain-containing protein [Arenicellales bacterium]